MKQLITKTGIVAHSRPLNPSTGTGSRGPGFKVGDVIMVAADDGALKPVVVSHIIDPLIDLYRVRPKKSELKNPYIWWKGPWVATDNCLADPFLASMLKAQGEFDP